MGVPRRLVTVAVSFALVPLLAVGATPVSGEPTDPDESTTSIPDSSIPDSTSPATTAPGGIVGVSPEVAARRGGRLQLTPTSPPPPSTTLPPLEPCQPGSLVRSVDTAGVPLVTFTFDDGPSPANTRPIMDAFSARGLTATFFVIGNNVREYPSIAREVADRGFLLANHTVTHRYTPSIIAREIGPMNDIIRPYTGRRPVYFRSPGLTQGSVIQSTLASYGMCNVFTSVDLRDWVSPRRSAGDLCSAFSRTLRPGMIVLLHDGGPRRPTTTAVPCMLDSALARGYRVVGLGELMASGRAVTGFAGTGPRISLVGRLVR
jgi:peptidoglycan-N-acetylglucosamine deacetylase